MWEHPALREYEKVREAEERRIKKIANPAERIRQYAWFDQWSREELEKVQMLINNHESTISDYYEERNYV